MRALTDALRAQRHEFANRLHTLAGLLQTDHHDEAVDYLPPVSERSALAAVGPAGRPSPTRTCEAFLAAKTAVAAEAGVRLELVRDQLGARPGGRAGGGHHGARQPGGQRARGRPARRPATGRVEVGLLADGDDAARLRGRHRRRRAADRGRRRHLPTASPPAPTAAGRGLGLALARQAARSLGGDVDPGRTGGRRTHGAVFVARLPAALVPTGLAGGRSMIRVLVVEDDFRVAQVHVDFTERVAGFTVAGAARTAAEARACCAARGPTWCCSTATCPTSSGLDLLAELTADTIMLTAASDAATVRAAFARGALNYLVKPFTAEQLGDRLSGVRALPEPCWPATAT